MAATAAAHVLRGARTVSKRVSRDGNEELRTEKTLMFAKKSNTLARPSTFPRRVARRLCGPLDLAPFARPRDRHRVSAARMRERCARDAPRTLAARARAVPRGQEGGRKHVHLRIAICARVDRVRATDVAVDAEIALHQRALAHGRAHAAHCVGKGGLAHICGGDEDLARAVAFGTRRFFEHFGQLCNGRVVGAAWKQPPNGRKVGRAVAEVERAFEAFEFGVADRAEQDGEASRDEDGLLGDLAIHLHLVDAGLKGCVRGGLGSWSLIYSLWTTRK